jgi:4-hydroxy-tetrahydrodipicolinate reductase
MTEPFSILIVGYGRMGRLVESLAPEYGARVAGRVDRQTAGRPEEWPAADVAIDFSTAGAVVNILPRLAARGTDLVIGTTGWGEHEGSMREALAPVGVVAAANFALGVNLFLAIASRAGALLAQSPQFGAWIHEAHHAAKKDAPSGTALAIQAAVTAAGYALPIDVASTRAGSIPGTHTLGFDSAAETITLTHTARDRSVFARGALEAARWVRGKRGWFTMKDVLGI